MAVAYTYADRLGTVDVAVSAVDDDIVVACRLHFEEIYLLFFFTQFVDVNKFRVAFVEPARDDVRRRVRRVKRSEAGYGKLQTASVQRDIFIQCAVKQSARVKNVTYFAVIKKRNKVFECDFRYVNAERTYRLCRFGCRINREFEVVEFFRKRNNFEQVVRVNA